MQEFLVLLLRPFDFADAGVEPFCPSSFALLWGLASEEGGYTCPLLKTVLGDTCLRDKLVAGFIYFFSSHTYLQDLVLNIRPYASLDDRHLVEIVFDVRLYWLTSLRLPV